MKIYFIDCNETPISIKRRNEIFSYFHSFDDIKKAITHKYEVIIFKYNKEYSYSDHKLWNYWKESISLYKQSKYKKFLNCKISVNK